MANNLNPNTYEEAQRMIEALETEAAQWKEALADKLADVDDDLRTAITAVMNDLLAQRDAIAERAIDLPTDAQFHAQQDALLEEAIRNDPYGGDDFALFNSGDCW